MRLFEVLLHASTQLQGTRSRDLHQRVLETFNLSESDYSLNQLRYDLRKLKGHGLLAREKHRYTYRLSEKGLKVALMFALFHKRICGPLANSLFGTAPKSSVPLSRIHAAFKRTEESLDALVATFKMAA